jgi:ADP-ribose pyrophosphatase YjhB (NUDIX family)
MELGETVEEAAIRETREEICCRVRLAGFHGLYSYKEAGVVTVVYRADIVGRSPRPGVEAQCVQSFLPSEIPWDDLSFLSTRDALRDWVSTVACR